MLYYCKLRGPNSALMSTAFFFLEQTLPLRRILLPHFLEEPVVLEHWFLELPFSILILGAHQSKIMIYPDF